MLGPHDGKPPPSHLGIQIQCKVMCVRYLAHSTGCIVSAQYTRAVIIIVQGLQRSWGRARVDGLLGSQFSVLSI